MALRNDSSEKNEFEVRKNNLEKQKNKNKVSLIIFLIVFTVVVGVIVNNIDSILEFFNLDDPKNQSTIVIEISVGIVIAIVIAVYSGFQHQYSKLLLEETKVLEQTQKQQLEIQRVVINAQNQQEKSIEMLKILNDLTVKQKNIIEKEEIFMKRREAYEKNQLRSTIEYLKENIENEQKIILDLVIKKTIKSKIQKKLKEIRTNNEFLIHKLKKVLNVGKDIIDPHILTAVDSLLRNYDLIVNIINDKDEMMYRYDAIDIVIKKIMDEVPKWSPSPGMDEKHIHNLDIPI